MNCEQNKLLQATADIEPILADSFLMDGKLTDLYLYAT